MLLFWDGHDAKASDFWVTVIGKFSSNPSVRCTWHGWHLGDPASASRLLMWVLSMRLSCRSKSRLVTKIFWPSKVKLRACKEVSIFQRKCCEFPWKSTFCPHSSQGKWVHGSHPGFQTRWFPNRTTWRWVLHPAPPWSAWSSIKVSPLNIRYTSTVHI